MLVIFVFSLLSKILVIGSSVTDINLFDNSIKDEGITAICEAVQSNKETKLASLNVGLNGIGPAGAKSVAAMAAVIGSLTALDAEYNLLGDDGKRVLQEVGNGREGFELKV